MAKKTEVLIMKVTREQKKAIREAAKREGVTMTDLVINKVLGIFSRKNGSNDSN